MALLLSQATSELNYQSPTELVQGINCPFGGKSRKLIHFNQLSEE